MTNAKPALPNDIPANHSLGELVPAMADTYGRYTGGPEW